MLSRRAYFTVGGRRKPTYLLYVARDLPDVVHQAIKRSMGVHLGPTPEREAAHALVAPDVGEHRLYGGDALAVQAPIVH